MARTTDSAANRARSNLLAGWITRLRDRVHPTYVDWSDIPDDPASPYRARLTIPAEQTDDGVEVREREVVRGKVNVVYENRCACGRRWFHRHFERVQMCPRCGCAVLFEPPQ